MPFLTALVPLALLVAPRICSRVLGSLAIAAGMCAASTHSRAADAPSGEFPRLREAAGGGLLIGGAASAADLADPKFAALYRRHFNAITARRDMMPSEVVDDHGVYDFSRADAVAQFARDNGLTLYGHMLLWQHLSRDWLFKDKDGRPLPRAQALANLKNYIDTVVGRYRGVVKSWDVVNEAIGDADGEYLRDVPARRAIGDDFIVKAFELAHAADPAAELYYTDYNIELPAKRAKTLRLLRELRAAGVRIDAVGIQGHWMLDSRYASPQVISDAIREFHAAGFKVMITELDVDVLPRTTSGADLVSVEEGPNPYANGLPDDVQQQLARRYAEIFDAILKPGVVTMITFWGTHDGHSWLNNFPVKRRTNHPLLFDRQLEPKPAFHAVIEALERAKRRTVDSR
jgi:endo-1,4-beta-xylanase